MSREQKRLRRKYDEKRLRQRTRLLLRPFGLCSYGRKACLKERQGGITWTGFMSKRTSFCGGEIRHSKSRERYDVCRSMQKLLCISTIRYSRFLLYLFKCKFLSKHQHIWAKSNDHLHHYPVEGTKLELVCQEQDAAQHLIH